jgi:hypothetical protein
VTSITLQLTVGSSQPEWLFFFGLTWSRMCFRERVRLQLFVNLFRVFSHVILMMTLDVTTTFRDVRVFVTN